MRLELFKARYSQLPLNLRSNFNNIYELIYSNRIAKPRKAARRVCSACLAFRQESDGLALSFPGRVSSVSSAGGLSMSHRVITRAAPLNFFAGKFRRDHGDRLWVISSRGGASLLRGL